MGLNKSIKVKLLPSIDANQNWLDEKGSPINTQLKSAMMPYVRTAANPSGLFVPGKYYDVYDFAGDRNSYYQVLLINEYGQFSFVNIEYVLAYVQPEVAVIPEGVVFTEKIAPSEDSAINTPTRLGRPPKSVQQ